jgi:prevent-host-death family protein
MSRKETTVGAFEAKTNLSQFLDRIESGECFVITRHGVPIARLVPYEEEVDDAAIAEAIDGILALRRGQTLGGNSVRDLIREGRA